MPRLPRLDLPGQFYHVIVRGIERRPIFRVEGDRAELLQRLGLNLARSGALCLTWALMTNHFHLLIIAGARGLAALLHPLLTGYVGAFNRRYRRAGHLVQNRYKSILCDVDQSDTQRQALARSGITLEALQSMAAEVTGADTRSILRRDRRRPVAEARALFVYAAAEFLGLRLHELATRLGLRSGSVSQARQRGQRLAESYHFVERLKSRLSTSFAPVP